MPILVGQRVVQPPETFAPVELDTLALTVTLSQGTASLELSGVWQILDGVEGFDDHPGIELDTTPASALLGEFASGLTAKAREVFIPIHLLTDGSTSWRSARDQLRTVVNPMLGDTTITVATGDGMSRSIGGRYLPESRAWGRDSWSPNGWQALGLLFKCPRPWWVGVPAILGPWRIPSTTGFLSTTFLPPALGESNVFGASVLIDNPGEVPTWPTWVITGSATAVTVVHEDTGRSWTLSTSGLTRPLTVTTEPTTAGVVDGTGARRWSSLASPYDLWPLPPGVSSVRVDITGADATTTVAATAPTLHLAAL